MPFTLITRAFAKKMLNRQISKTKVHKSYHLKQAHDEPFLRENTVLIYHITAIPNPPSKDGENSLRVTGYGFTG
jgi:hypothetical protein